MSKRANLNQSILARSTAVVGDTESDNDRRRRSRRSKGNVWVSVGDFHIEGPRYWEVVMAAGNTHDETKRTAEEAVALIKSIVFFD
jgi:hypothetical protein